ncbi:metal ABC transporter ATP-binding protein [Vibrio sp. Of7-15]|uniref:metal ABC transporter ATP-binding protein n=1 Tax=Vibrio sp. Of7-15 TaxID=2724879 RepID=UPI001EF21BBB|nr:metal ABC transporter ATP-binding protein [Vibrio sp. Of7-15]MCG7496035.1 metal ABC transporter ATP-binding protein [Vibrio sp. Of7-15]
MMGPKIELNSVTLRYGDHTVLEPINHTFSAGQCHILMGPNGGGKTSLLRSILGLTPFRGDINIYWPERESSGEVSAETASGVIGYVPQKAMFEGSLPLSVMDFVMLNMTRTPLFFSRWSKQYRENKARVLESLDRVGMANRASLRMGQLSGGEQQRVLFAQSLLDSPKLLILDEPTTGMDEQGVRYLEQLIHELTQQGTTILAVHHDISAVRRILSKTEGSVHVINRQLVDSGSVSEVLHADKIERLFNHYSGHMALEPECSTMNKNEAA